MMTKTPSSLHGSLADVPCAVPDRRRDAFSLIELVLAIGVVAFALVGIFSLFSASLKVNKDSSAQQEGFEVAAMVTSWMQNTNVFTPTVLSNLFKTNYTLNSAKTIAYFVFTSNPPAGSVAPTVTCMTNVLPTTFSTITNGLLYYVLLGPCTNLPANVFIGANAFPVYLNNWMFWPGYPGHATVYSLPNPANTNMISNSAPVISFDFIIPK
jgi:type II secretory pathway pseudopilin PulG